MSGVKQILIATAALLGLAGCAANGVVVPDLDAAAEAGRQVSLEQGCATCHGQYGQGGAAGTFFGLWGSEVELEDGTVVTADADYLRRAIVDPAAEIVAGSNLEMPAVAPTDDQVDALLIWIEALVDE